MTWEADRRAFERAYWQDLFARHGGRIPAMARESGCNRTAVYKLLKKFGIPVMHHSCGNRGKWDRPIPTSSTVSSP